MKQSRIELNKLLRRNRAQIQAQNLKGRRKQSIDSLVQELNYIKIEERKQNFYTLQNKLRVEQRFMEIQKKQEELRQQNVKLFEIVNNQKTQIHKLNNKITILQSRNTQLKTLENTIKQDHKIQEQYHRRLNFLEKDYLDQQSKKCLPIVFLIVVILLTGIGVIGFIFTHTKWVQSLKDTQKNTFMEGTVITFCCLFFPWVIYEACTLHQKNKRLSLPPQKKYCTFKKSIKDGSTSKGNDKKSCVQQEIENHETGMSQRRDERQVQLSHVENNIMRKDLSDLGTDRES